MAEYPVRWKILKIEQDEDILYKVFASWWDSWRLNSGLVEYEDFCRYLTRTELELAQTVDVGYTNCLSYNQACAVLGNGWTVDVICHILKGLKEET